MKTLILSCLLILAGCCSTLEKSAPTSLFQRKHPLEFRQYAYLNPVSLDTYRAIWGERAGASSYILDEMQRRFGDTPGVMEFVKQMAQQEGKDRKRLVDSFRELQQLSASGGAVCQFEWSDGKTREIGLLVLKAGEVIRREPWVTDYLSEQPEKEAAPK